MCDRCQHLGSTADVVNIYDRLQEVSMKHLLALIPFNGILLHFCFESLCPLDLELIKYGAMSKGVMDLLPLLIPGTLLSQVSAA